MKDAPKNKNGQKGKPHVLGLQAFAAISAVEGLALNIKGKARLERLRSSALTPEERRAEILKAYAKRAKK